MTYIESSSSIVTSRSHHQKAAEQHEKGFKHHRQAALLLDAGDARQAGTHANIALRHAMDALETGHTALKV